MTSQPRTRSVASAFAAAFLPFLLAAFAAQPATAGSGMALRVNDATGAPGGTVAVVLRTYAPRAIGQGQICIRGGGRRPVAALADPGGIAGTSGSGEGSGETAPGTPFATLLGAKVFGARDDVRWSAAFHEDGEVMVSFHSPSGTINTTDGPMVVLYLRLADDVVEGQRFDLKVDFAETLLFDARGRPITVDPRPGRLEIKHEGDLYPVRAAGARIRPGQVAKLGLETRERAALSGGKIGLRFDPSVAAGVPRVRIDKRFGKATFLVDRTTPGLVIVEFESADGSLNRVPGKIIEVRVPTSPEVRPGKRTRVWLDPNFTYLVDRDGDLLPLEVGDGRLEFK
jgi:hypothetical protein